MRSMSSSSFSSFSVGRMSPARAESASCSFTYCELITPNISIKNGALKPMDIGVPS